MDRKMACSADQSGDVTSVFRNARCRDLFDPPFNLQLVDQVIGGRHSFSVQGGKATNEVMNIEFDRPQTG